MASRSLGSLTADLVVRMGGFKTGMDAGARQAADFEKRVSGSFRAISGSFSKLAGVIGVGIGLEALRRAAADAIEFGDNIEKAVAKTGIGAEKISELAYAAQQTDVPFEGLTTSLKKMQIALSEAASGVKAPNETLRALGLTIEELKRLEPDQQFELLADRISKLKDPADRARAAVDLFGKAGADLLPLFEDGASGIQKLREEAHKLGATLTDEQAKALAEADDSIKRLKASFSGFARTLTAEVAPALSQFLDNLNAIVSGDKIGKLREQIDFLQRNQGHGFVSVGYGEIGTGFFTAAEGASKLLELEKQLHDEEQRGITATGAGLAPGGHSRAPFVPGFQPEAAKGTTSAIKSQQDELKRLQDQYAAVYTTGSQVLQELETPTEAVTRKFEEQRSALEQLAQTYPSFADQAQQGIARAAVAAQDELDALQRNNGELERQAKLQEERDQIFEATRTDAERYAETLAHLNEVFQGGATDQETYGRAVADAVGAYVDGANAADEYRLVVEELNKQLAAGTLQPESYAAAVAKAKDTLSKATDQLNEFWKEAARNSQNILADFLYDPFKDGIKGMIASFADMLRQMAAQAVAADIAGKIFGSNAGGTGAGLLGTFINWAGSYFGGSSGLSVPAITATRLWSGGYTGDGGKFEPAGIVHRGEYVVPKSVVDEPGAMSFLRGFHEHGMAVLDGLPGFAGGGFVTAGPSPSFGYGSAAMRAIASATGKAGESGSVHIEQHFVIDAPQGSVSRATQQQIGAQAFRGAARAAGRNA